MVCHRPSLCQQQPDGAAVTHANNLHAQLGTDHEHAKRDPNDGQSEFSAHNSHAELASHNGHAECGSHNRNAECRSHYGNSIRQPHHGHTKLSSHNIDTELATHNGHTQRCAHHSHSERGSHHRNAVGRAHFGSHSRAERCTDNRNANSTAVPAPVGFALRCPDHSSADRHADAAAHPCANGGSLQPAYPSPVCVTHPAAIRCAIGAAQRSAQRAPHGGSDADHSLHVCAGFALLGELRSRLGRSPYRVLRFEVVFVIGRRIRQRSLHRLDPRGLHRHCA
jgi:hypothetical protein